MPMKPISLLHVDLMTASQHLQNMSLLGDMYTVNTDRVLRPDNDDDDGNIEVVDEDFYQPRTHTVTKNPPCMDELLKNFKENLFKFVLKCREKNHLPLSVQEEIVDDVNFLLCFFLRRTMMLL